MVVSQKVADRVQVEGIIKAVFRKIFIERKDRGSEYFEGDIDKMIEVLKLITTRST